MPHDAVNMAVGVEKESRRGMELEAEVVEKNVELEAEVVEKKAKDKPPTDSRT